MARRPWRRCGAEASGLLLNPRPGAVPDRRRLVANTLMVSALRAAQKRKPALAMISNREGVPLGQGQETPRLGPQLDPFEAPAHSQGGAEIRRGAALAAPRIEGHTREAPSRGVEVAALDHRRSCADEHLAMCLRGPLHAAPVVAAQGSDPGGEDPGHLLAGFGRAPAPRLFLFNNRNRYRFSSLKAAGPMSMKRCVRGADRVDLEGSRLIAFRSVCPSCENLDSNSIRTISSDDSSRVIRIPHFLFGQL